MDRRERISNRINDESQSYASLPSESQALLSSYAVDNQCGYYIKSKCGYIFIAKPEYKPGMGSAQGEEAIRRHWEHLINQPLFESKEFLSRNECCSREIDEYIEGRSWVSFENFIGYAYIIVQMSIIMFQTIALAVNTSELFMDNQKWALTTVNAITFNFKQIFFYVFLGIILVYNFLIIPSPFFEKIPNLKKIVIVCVCICLGPFALCMGWMTNYVLQTYKELYINIAFSIFQIPVIRLLLSIWVCDVFEDISPDKVVKRGNLIKCSGYAYWALVAVCMIAVFIQIIIVTHFLMKSARNRFETVNKYRKLQSGGSWLERKINKFKQGIVKKALYKKGFGSFFLVKFYLQLLVIFIAIVISNFWPTPAALTCAIIQFSFAAYFIWKMPYVDFVVNGGFILSLFSEGVTFLISFLINVTHNDFLRHYGLFVTLGIYCFCLAIMTLLSKKSKYDESDDFDEIKITIDKKEKKSMKYAKRLIEFMQKQHITGIQLDYLRYLRTVGGHRECHAIFYVRNVKGLWNLLILLGRLANPDSKDKVIFSKICISRAESPKYEIIDKKTLNLLASMFYSGIFRKLRHFEFANFNFKVHDFLFFISLFEKSPTLEVLAPMMINFYDDDCKYVGHMPNEVLTAMNNILLNNTTLRLKNVTCLNAQGRSEKFILS